MKYEVIIQPQAVQEAEDAYQWIAQQAPLNAARWFNGLMEAIRSLEILPRGYGLARENSFFKEEIRQLIYGNYRILYTIIGQQVHVLHIRHAARKTLKPE